MFTLYTLEETVQIPPHLFGKPRHTALEHVLNKRFSDRLIPNLGLGIGVWDIVKSGEDRLVAQSGESSTEVIFRLIVFRPFVGEVMFSRINASTEAGLFLDVGFFDAVHVPQKRLPKPVSWEGGENVWIWRPEGGAELFMDVSNECVCRVEEVKVDGGGMWVLGGLFDDVVGDNQGLGDPLWWIEEEGGEGEQEGYEGEQEGYEGEGGEMGEYEGGEEGQQGGYEDGGGEDVHMGDRGEGYEEGPAAEEADDYEEEGENYAEGENNRAGEDNTAGEDNAVGEGEYKVEVKTEE